MNVIEQPLAIILCIVFNVSAIKFYKSERPAPVYRALPCEDERIESVFRNGLNDGYNITIKKDLKPSADIRLTFDSQAAVLLDETARFSNNQDDIQNIFSITLLRSSSSFTFNVRGHSVPFAPPYLTSLKINGEELCDRHNLTYFKDFPVGVLSNVERNCGRRKILHTALIYEGTNAKPGDWPWHAAINKYDGGKSKYICGGTLISERFVLTAAHCATKRGVILRPDALGVVLGKYNLYEIDIAVQEKHVHKIFVHEQFQSSKLKNDIALLKLTNDVAFNNYVQPACLWDQTLEDRLSFDAFGSVVGWGYDKSDVPTSTLHLARMPQISQLDCILSRPEFYGNLLTDGNRFCAGFKNGTSVCNGDSGGAFLYFVPDIADSKGDIENKIPGAWHVKGIVSTTLSREDAAICDPTAYAIFTDVGTYLPWIKEKLAQ